MNVLLQVLTIVAFLSAIITFVGLVIYSIESDWHRAKFTAYGFRFDSYAIDTHTGFPRLPAGWKWEVYLIEPRGRFERLGIRLLDESGYQHGSENFYTDIYRWHRLHLRTQANKIMRRMRSQHVQTADPSRFVGEYPPKTIRVRENGR
jgi:hypothetical protein